MAGQDPRPKPSELYRLVHEIHSKNPDSLPTQEQWDEIKTQILFCAELHGQPVDLSTSKSAAETLYASLWPKLKAMEVQGSVDHQVGVSEPLTKEEMQAFAENFVKEF
jgi:hypothetical protein